MRYYVATCTQPGNLTVSEGHGYGMILAALMAGHDPDAQVIFDGMYAYFRDHPTATHQHLMSWYQNNSCADANGNDSATDGDLDIAFALVPADKQWGSGGAIDYLTEAKLVITDVKDGETDASHRYVLLGDWVMTGDTQYYPSTRSSDFMVDHFRSYLAATGDGDWSGLLDRTYQIVDTLKTNSSPVSGLLPDFVKNALTDPQPVAPHFLEGPNDGAYDYNACRDPWRLATDYLVSGDVRAKTAVQRIDTWIRGQTGNDPSNIKSGYRLDGSMSPGADYLSMAFVAPLGVGAMVDTVNQGWLNALWDLIVSTPLADGGYYENTLKLLAMIVMSGNWWAPEAVATTCGDGTIDPGEQCGEPGLDCAGACTTCSSCHCVPTEVCGDGMVCGSEACEADTDCSGGHVCRDCQCVNPPPCESGNTIQRPVLSVVASPFSLRFKGEAVIPKPWQAVDPVANGVRIAVDGLSGPGGIDVTIPGGVRVGGLGWNANAAGTQWIFTDPAGSQGGVTRVVVKDRSRATDGLVRWTVKGRGGAVALPDVSEVRSAMIVGNALEFAGVLWNPPTGARPRCGGGGTSLICR